ncbi:helix-turn-helix transcriptional regulator, partial [Vannielia litorea]|uniref:helix-turn-helix transcriptional regulator n=1 Tax=Vannielia litorea TaxID=1217970 RepID=UPI001FD05361
MIGAILAVQVLCAVFFLSNILSSVLGYAPVSWQISEYIELGAALGLVLGVGLGAVALRRSHERAARLEDSMRAASGAFMDLLEDRFEAWSLTPAERDVALFSIKGMSTAEIAGLRSTSEGTVKAQTAAVYRKAGVSGRPQLMSLFIEDLMGGPLGDPADRGASPPVRRV